MQLNQCLEKFIALNAYFRQEERFKINHLTTSFMKLEIEELIKSKISRRKELMSY